MTGMLGKKRGMISWFLEDGQRISATVLEVGPCVVTQVKTIATDGYAAVQLGYGDRKDKHTTKPMAGHFQKAHTPPRRHVHEFRLSDSATDLKVGDSVTLDALNPALPVTVSGTSKGRGFAGVMKRHGFSGGPATHGQSDRQRAPGSIGNASYPGRVFKGQRMPGRMGGKRVTVQRLRVERVDVERNLLLIRGAVPGAPNGLLAVRHVELDESKLPPRVSTEPPVAELEAPAAEAPVVEDAPTEEASVAEAEAPAADEVAEDEDKAEKDKDEEAGS